MQLAHTRIRLGLPFTSAFTACRFTFQRRFVTLCAWEMLLPNCGPLPQTSHTCAILSAPNLSEFPCQPELLPNCCWNSSYPSWLALSSSQTGEGTNEDTLTLKLAELLVYPEAPIRSKPASASTREAQLELKEASHCKKRSPSGTSRKGLGEFSHREVNEQNSFEVSGLVLTGDGDNNVPQIRSRYDHCGSAVSGRKRWRCRSAGSHCSAGLSAVDRLRLRGSRRIPCGRASLPQAWPGR